MHWLGAQQRTMARARREWEGLGGKLLDGRARGGLS